MRRLALVASLLLGLTGCSLTIDPNSVPPPVAGCVPVCNATLTCGVTLNNCNTTCAVGSGCTTPAATHTIQGRLTAGAGSSSVAGGHSVARGTLGGGTASAAATSGHSISQGTLSP
jgi:hypothetical protein